MDLTPIVNYVLGAGFVGIMAALVRWGWKVDKNFSNQAVVNEKFLGALNLLQAKLEAHEELDVSRLDALEQRVALSERPVASNGGTRHARKRS